MAAPVNQALKTLECPSGLQAVDADWITRCLGENGVEAQVTGLEVKPVGTGQMAHCVRFTLHYAYEDAGGPASLIGKFSSPHEVSKNSGNESGYYLREVGFYQQFAPTALLSIPKCFHASHDAAKGEFALILEDLAPAEQGDQLQGVTLEQAANVVREAAKLHASHWDDDTIDTLPWVYGTKAARQPPELIDAVRGMWQGFSARYAGRIDPEAKNIGDRFFKILDVYDNGHSGPRGLTHNDFRPDNMMFATEKGGRPVTIVDWQTLAYGHGASDVCYFLSGALAPQVRRAHEQQLLDIYYNELLALNVTGYPRAQFNHDYAWHGFQLFLSAVIGAMVVQQTERGDKMFMVMLHGAADQITQWDSLKLIEAQA